MNPEGPGALARSAITFVTPGDGRTFRKMKPYLEGALEETIASKFKFID